MTSRAWCLPSQLPLLLWSLLHFVASAEKYSGIYELPQEQTWLVIAVAGNDNGRFNVSFNGIWLNELAGLGHWPLQMCVFPDSIWPFPSYGPRGPQPCGNHTNRRITSDKPWDCTELGARNIIEDRLWDPYSTIGSCTAENYERRYIWYVVLTSCGNGIDSVSSHSTPAVYTEKCSLKWDLTVTYPTGKLSDDVRTVRYVSYANILLSLLTVIVALGASSENEECNKISFTFYVGIAMAIISEVINMCYVWSISQRDEGPHFISMCGFVLDLFSHACCEMLQT